MIANNEGKTRRPPTPQLLRRISAGWTRREFSLRFDCPHYTLRSVELGIYKGFPASVVAAYTRAGWDPVKMLEEFATWKRGAR